MSAKNSSRVRLPKSWTAHVRSAMLHVISLARFATAYTRGGAANRVNQRVRLRAENSRLRQECAHLQEEIRIKDARMAQVSPQRRPHYSPQERMAILELRAARGWTLQQTADVFLLTAPTIASWMKRLNEEGPQALVQLREPVNKFPEFMRYAVQRLKTLCPSMGKVKIAQILSRAGLHLGATTVGRILKESPKPNPHKSAVSTGREVTAKRPNHVWHVDLTTVPIGGFWTSWLPFALPQSWPFCWWLAVVVDHFSRRIVSIGVFAKRPDCRTVCALLERAIRHAHAEPKYIISDRDRIFDCRAFRQWAKRKGMNPPRYGAIGKHGSIAVVERTIRTIKDECTRRLFVPFRRDQFRREIRSFVEWYNEHRPHTTLAGRTPNEVHFRRKPFQQKPRIEPRRQWPRPSPCAKPQTLVAGQPGDRFELHIERLKRRNHLPVVTLSRAA
jgi:putative transposase